MTSSSRDQTESADYRIGLAEEWSPWSSSTVVSPSSQSQHTTLRVTPASAQSPAQSQSQSIFKPQYHDDEIDPHKVDKSRSDLHILQSASTWPTIAKSSIIPKYNHIFTLFASLLLSTTLAFFSALDAFLNCTYGYDVWSSPWFGSSSSNQGGDAGDGDGDGGEYYNNRKLEDGYYEYEYQQQEQQNENNYYDYYQNNDDDYNSRLSEARNCKELFTNAIIPVCPILITLCFISCRWTINSQDWKKLSEEDASNNSSNTNNNTNNVNTIPSTINFSGRRDDHDLKRFEEFKAHVHHQAEHLTSCYKLFLIALVCLGTWTYAQVMIFKQSDIPYYNENEEESLFKLQFQSLGAINNVGEVGQNANLYYSCWISLLVSIALVYELGRIAWKHYGTMQNLEMELARITRYKVTETNAVEVIMTRSKSQQHLVQEKRSAWHESLYKLRYRTGIWLTTLIASALVYTSSNRVWNNHIYPAAVANGEVEDDGTLCTIFHGYISMQSLDENGLLDPSKCERTKAARATGIVCVGLSIFALVAHYNMHRQVARELKSSSELFRNREGFGQILEKRRKLIPLRLECLFACVLSVVLAINALFATAVEGPASKVGDLYYSSWIAFVSSMRLTLACLEDILEEDDEVLEQNNSTLDNTSGISGEHRRLVRPKMTRLFSMHTNFQVKEDVSCRLVMLAGTKSFEQGHGEASVGSYIGGMPIPEQNGLHQMFEERVVEEEEASRAKRMRRWASGCIFSTIYLMSALDAVSLLACHGDCLPIAILSSYSLSNPMFIR